MKVIISPTKEQKKTPYNFEGTKPLFSQKANKLVFQLNKMSIEQIQTSFKCSENIANKVFSYYQNFNKETHPALFFFSGLQYKNIGVDSLKKSEINFLLDNLLIADSLYGVLRSSDVISHYRLDYTVKLPFFSYDYYKEDLDTAIESKIINLCSKEFSKNLNPSKLFNINFVQKVKGKTKSYSTHTKIARGKFVRYLAQNLSTSLDVLKKFNVDGYFLKSSRENELTFQKSIS